MVGTIGQFAQLQGKTKTAILTSGVQLSGSGLRVLRFNAEQAEIEPVIYDEENVDEPSQEDADLYLEQSQKINEMKPEKIRKSSVEPSLLAKVEDLPTAEEVGVSDNTQEEEVE